MKLERIGRMGNKLKDIFSDAPIDMGGNIRFESEDAYKKFLEALDIVWEEGKTVEVEGVSSILTKIKSGKYEYPFLEHDKLKQVVIAPSPEMVDISLSTELGEKFLHLRRYHTAKEIVLETPEKAIVYMKMKVKKGSTQNTFSYRVQTELAKTMDEIVESYVVVVAFINSLFVDDVNGTAEEIELIRNTKNYFTKALEYYQRVQQVEKDFAVHFNPAIKNEDETDEQELEELYGLLYEKMAFRYNAKLTTNDGLEVTEKMKEIEIGSKLELTFSSKAEFRLYGQTITLYTANILSNAVVKNVEQTTDGKVKILYHDTDSEPMYISYTAFKSEEDRESELKVIMEHGEKYVNAPTVAEYMWQKRS